eukprot:10494978-Alexandrium_andersonii.AAC.1
MWDNTFSPIHARLRPVVLCIRVLRGGHSGTRDAGVHSDAHRSHCARSGMPEQGQGRRAWHVFTHMVAVGAGGTAGALGVRGPGVGCSETHFSS